MHIVLGGKMEEVYSFLGNISASKTNSLSLTLLCKGILLIVTVAQFHLRDITCNIKRNIVISYLHEPEN